MKPLHVGLLVIGAALAGGVAVKMSQAPAYRAPLRAPASRSVTQAEPVPPVTAPAPVTAEPATMAPPPVEEQPAPAKPLKTHQGSTKPAHLPHLPAPSTVSARVPRVEVTRVAPLPPVPVPYQVPPASEPATPTNTPERTVSAAPALPDPAPTETAPGPPPPPAPLQVTLHQGTQIAVRLDQTLSSDHLFAGDSFQASLAEPLVVDGFIIGERGARVSGRVVASKNAGRLTGASELQLCLLNFQTADGQKIAISTEPWSKEADPAHGQDVAKIGGGAALGAIIGAIAGGGKGAAIGAGVGGAAGTGAAAATRGKSVTLPAESILRFRLATRVSVTERQL